jgi:hypothetical protein
LIDDYEANRCDSNHPDAVACQDANKYWMPWQRNLSTQYGFGGTVGFAMTPYVNTSTFGSLLQKLVWSDRDNPMNFRPHPMSRPPVKR